MKEIKMSCCCHTCKKKLHKTKHFTADDVRILCYVCRIKEKAKPSNKGFVSVLGNK